ncbi:LLM class flavin-dependent oxidoreductase [Lentzea sp. NPDC051838]|uniref:LLM class flavin-dependent oxidoreductase n=1 Tax=Lentzea sp. NPDC051838 TaxID=3154849 RepID=UPI0034372D4F
MKFGISLLPDCRPAKRSAAQYYSDVIEVSALADSLGIDYVKMTEHYMKDYGGYCPSPLTFLAAVASRTERIRLMTGGIQASFHHPVQLAAQTAQVDALSGGRLDVGFARAWLPYEFEAFEVDLDTSRARFIATIEAVERLWTQEKASEDTEFFRYTDIPSLPAPTQSPHPPVWVAAVRSLQSFAWIGEKGFNLLIASPPREEELPRTKEMLNVYLETFEQEHGASGRAPGVALSIPLYIAETDDEAYAKAEPLLREYLDVWAEAADSWKNVTSPDYQGYAAAGKTFRSVTAKDLRSVATGVIGSPATVLEKIEEIRANLPVDTLLWQIDFGGQDLESMSRSVRLFAEEVMPKVR